MSILEGNKKLRQANESLESINKLQGEKVALLEERVKKNDALFERMKKDIEEKEGLIDNLRDRVAKDADHVSVLEKEMKKKDEAVTKLCTQVIAAEQIVEGIAEKSEAIYHEYKATIALFGAEPLPLPSPKGARMTYLLCLAGYYKSFLT